MRRVHVDACRRMRATVGVIRRDRVRSLESVCMLVLAMPTLELGRAPVACGRNCGGLPRCTSNSTESRWTLDRATKLRQSRPTTALVPPSNHRAAF